MSLNEADFNYVQALVERRSAIVLEDQKKYLVEARLGSLARREGFDSLSSLVIQLRSSSGRGDLHDKVVESMTINETTFFRDVHPFDALRKEVLPALLRQRGSERRLRIWCAASSSGQEPYSIAMLLREHFPELASWKVRILATDLSQDMLARARQGTYSQTEVNRGLPARLLVKHFRKQGDVWQLSDDIRRMVDFRRLNLNDTWPELASQDVIFLRNVLIYFDVATKKHILGKVRSVLRPDGSLFLGGGETTLNLDSAFERRRYERGCCYGLAPSASVAG